MNAVRGDIADVALAGTLFAPHYAKPLLKACVKADALILDAPSRSGRAVSQLLHGEDFAVIDISGGWAWGYCRHDHYVGYVSLDALGATIQPTHVVNHRSTLVFAQPDSRGPFIGTYSMGTLLQGIAEDDFLHTDAGYILLRHVRPVAERDADPVALAERLLGTPYYWGGRGFDGIDCSGLVQLTLGLTGIAVPRDSDQQQAAIGKKIAASDKLRRGDLVFIPGHVGMMFDDERLIHANGHAMSVTIDPLAEVLARHDQPTMIAKRIAQ